MNRLRLSACALVVGTLVAFRVHETAAQVAPSDPPCTLETPLVPGVPGSPGHLLTAADNPNGRSELAALMRTMQADLQAAGTAATLGQPVPKMLARHARIRCAWPTTPSDRDARFDAMAQVYLAQVAALEAAPPPDARAAVHRVLNACKGCHEQTCPGPIAAIEKLRPGPLPGAPASLP